MDCGVDWEAQVLAVDTSCDCVEVKAQSNELTRGTIELVQNFRLQGEFT